MILEAGPGLVLRATTESDLDWVVEVEGAPAQLPFVSQWPRDLHAQALADPGAEHRIIETSAGRAGYAILRGIGDVNGSVELTRLVVTEKGRGIGRQALRALIRHAFDTHHAHRVWLDVFAHNQRARRLYRAEGFVEEGTLREAVMRDGEHRSLVLMSMLRREYEAREGSVRPGMEIGIYSFAETPIDAAGRQLGAGERLRNLLEEIELADQVGLDVFGVGEHHRPDYAVSAPAVVLAAAAARTRRIRLTSAVSVLSSDDPVRVFQDFATLDLLSGGRAEIMAGRGSFTESFPLFGQDLADYDELFTEKLDLLLQLREQERITWSGRHRAAIADRAVYPRPQQSPLPVWVAVGGTPRSVVRAATLGLPMALAIIGGAPERFAPIVDLYRDAATRAGRDPASLPIGINAHGFIADDSRAAADLAWPPYAATMTRIGRERGWPPATRARFDAELSLRGALFVGNPQQVIDKILFQHGIFAHRRFLLQLTVGPMPHDRVMRAIELLGTVVAPAVRAATAAGSERGEGASVR